MAILFLNNSELKGSTFRSRLINFSGRDISSDVFSLVVKNNLGTEIKTILPTVQGNVVLFQLAELESLSSSTCRLEYWGNFEGLGKEMIAFETLVITNSPDCLQKNKNISITATVEIEDVNINIAISNPVVHVIGEGGGTGSGENGKSAYEIAVLNGFTGTEAEWLVSLKGADGNDFKYEDFTPEQLALLHGKDGKDFQYSDFTPEQLALLKGEKGEPFSFEDFTQSQLELLKGEKGKAFEYSDFTPEQLALLKGTDGKSAYQIWLDAGNTGSVTTFLNSLKGADGSGTKLPLYSAIKSANIVAGTQFINDEDWNVIYRVKTGQTLLTTENPANVVGTKVDLLGGIKESTAVIPLIFVDGKALTGTGALNNDVAFETTSFIPISGTKSKLKITTGMVFSFAHRVIAYDANKVFLSVIVGAGGDLINGVFEQPENCAFIKITNRKDRGITPSLSVTTNTIATIENGISKNSEILNNVPLVVNKIDGKYISPTGGSANNANFEYANFDVFPHEELIVTAGVVAGAYSPIVYFDKYNSVITSHSNIQLDGVKVVVPSGCYKISVNNYKPANRSLSVVRQPVSYASAQTKANNADKLKDLTDAKNFYEIASGVPSYNLDDETVGIIVAGQSNAEGRIPNADFPTSYLKNLPNVKINNNNVSGVFSPMNVTGQWAFDSIVFNKISQKLNGADFYVVKRTRGATSVAYRYPTSFNADIKLFENNPTWESQLYYLEKAIRNALATNPNIKFKAILWHQGEADGSNYNPTYYRDLLMVIYYIRGIVDNPILPFIFGTIPTNSTEYNALIYDDFVKISQNIPYCYMVDLGVTSMLSDGVHFDASAAQSFGESVWAIIDSNKMIRKT